MAERIKIKLVANGHVWCYPSDVGPIEELNQTVITTIKGKRYEVADETAEELIARLNGG